METGLKRKALDFQQDGLGSGRGLARGLTSPWERAPRDRRPGRHRPQRRAWLAAPTGGGDGCQVTGNNPRAPLPPPNPCAWAVGPDAGAGSSGRAAAWPGPFPLLTAGPADHARSCSASHPCGFPRGAGKQAGTSVAARAFSLAGSGGASVCSVRSRQQSFRLGNDSRAPRTCPWADAHRPCAARSVVLDSAVPHGMLTKPENFPEKTATEGSRPPAGCVSSGKSLQLSEPPRPEPMVLQALAPGSDDEDVQPPRKPPEGGPPRRTNGLPRRPLRHLCRAGQPPCRASGVCLPSVTKANKLKGRDIAKWLRRPLPLGTSGGAAELGRGRAAVGGLGPPSRAPSPTGVCVALQTGRGSLSLRCP